MAFGARLSQVTQTPASPRRAHTTSASDPSDPSDPSDVGPRTWAAKVTSPGVLLAVAVAGFVLLCLVVSHLSRFYAYDEAIYLSQIYPGHALPFTAPRARGLTWLVWPLGRVDASVSVVRAYVLTLNAGLMYLGFRAWLPILGRRTALAAAFLGLSWPVVFEATEVFPNLPVALLAVGAAGYLARSASASAQTRSGALWKAGLALAVAGMIRPMEASFVTAGLLAGALLLPAGRSHTRGWTMLRRRWAALLAGLAAGWLPWLIEAQTGFGGPVQRMRDASANVSGGLHPENVRRQLELTDGPVSWSAPAHVPVAGLIWWGGLGLALLLSLGVVLYRLAAVRSSDPGIALAGGALAGGALAGLAGAASAAQYLLFTGVVEARFLVPAYALLTLTAAALLPQPQAGRIRLPQAASLGGALLVLVGFGIWQVGTVSSIGRMQEQTRQYAHTLSRILQRETRGQPCRFASQYAFPVIAFASGCEGTRFAPDRPIIYVSASGPAGAPMYVLSATDPRNTMITPQPGTVRDLSADGVPGWWLSVVPDSAVSLAT